MRKARKAIRRLLNVFWKGVRKNAGRGKRAKEGSVWTSSPFPQGTSTVTGRRRLVVSAARTARVRAKIAEARLLSPPNGKKTPASISWLEDRREAA